MLKSSQRTLRAVTDNHSPLHSSHLSKKTCGRREFNRGPSLNRIIAGIVLSIICFGNRGLMADDYEVARKAVVRIDVSFFEYSYDAPWKQPAVRRASGTGFIFSGKHILTNAHVVSQSVTIRVKRPDQKTDYVAHIQHIAHDCDLALLVVDNEEFFKGSEQLTLGPAPELNSPVTVVGFPIGGDRVSITRGIVSRKDMDTYAHSGVDSHATIQVDAAINPGNSGGPGIQNGHVIGVAFQSLTRGEGLGYLIPPEVIQKFITDVADGKYDGYVDFGTDDLQTRNPVMRSALGLKEDDAGVYVYNVLPGSSVDGFIKPGDLILSVRGNEVSSEGEIDFNGRLMSYVELLDNLPAGEKVEVEVMRDGKKQKVVFAARRSKLIDFLRVNYDTAPPYYVAAGHVFQPLDANLMQQNSRNWTRDGRADLLYFYNNYLTAHLYQKAGGFVVLTQRLNDESNSYGDRYLSKIVEFVNGEKVKDFAHFAQLMNSARSGKEIVVRFHNSRVPLVLETESLKAINERIRKTYSLRADSFVPGAMVTGGAN